MPTADIVMEGGGVKGTALVGALAVLEDRGYRYINLAGTSAGAIVAALVAAGYSAHELRDIMGDLDYRRFLDGGLRWLPPRTRAAYNLLRHWGIYRGDAFLEWLRGMLAAKDVRTFGDLKRGIPDRNGLYRLRVVASDVTRGRMLVLPDAIEQYGIARDDLEVALAVRMSMSIPGFYRPVTLRNEAGDPSYVVDGALLSNFPISLFDGPGMDERPTFGLRLTNPARERVSRFHARGLLTYTMAMFLTATEAADERYIEAHDFIRTIAIDSRGVSPTHFDIAPAEKDMLYDAGVAAARDFLETWDFAEWKRNYSRWAGLDRRRLIWQHARGT